MPACAGAGWSRARCVSESVFKWRELPHWRLISRLVVGRSPGQARGRCSTIREPDKGSWGLTALSFGVALKREEKGIWWMPWH